MITAEVSFLFGFVAILIYIIFSLILKFDIKKIIYGCLFISYLSVVVAITIFPITYDIKTEYFGDVTWYNFVPLRTISGAFEYGINQTAVLQVLGNILISVPYGVFVILTVKRKTIAKLVLLGFILAFAIELTQLFIGLYMGNMYRNVDIDDIILNVIGVYVGYIFYKLLPIKLKKSLLSI